jgi:hypothetical protein
MVKIRVPKVGQREMPITHEGWEIPAGRNNHFEYEVTTKQAARWEKLPPAKKKALILKAEKENKDLRELI